MTLPSTGAISFSNIGSEVYANPSYSVEMNWIKNTATKDSVSNMDSLHARAWYQRNVDGACDNGNCTNNNCNCGNITNAFNCYITTSQCTHSAYNCTTIEYGSNCNCEGINVPGVNCTNCDTRAWLQGNCNCNTLGGYNCNQAAWATNCNCDCAPPPPPPACDCACACACDCAPPPPPPACDCNCACPPANCASECECACACDCYPSCFPAGTPVLMADGTLKMIEDVQIGEFLVGAYGEINEVLALDQPIVGNRKMIIINGDLIITPTHPLWNAGTNSFGVLDVPGYWKIENATLQPVIVNVNGDVEYWRLPGLLEKDSDMMTQLSLGDVIKTNDGSRVIESIEYIDMPYETQLYNFVLNGSHTYHVHGYVATGFLNGHDFDYRTWSKNGSAFTIDDYKK